ncbi:ribosomal protein S21 [Kwoniella mangroviensis CBS 10435]|uniref:Ribosomal protein S21 n=1 Tax=Kwoniella mangroviensis CBS 10435 TaxID=1331196 RepID=A0A1B9IQJ6_9TREE|nr:ribosomal protein S21 [Kwoniella mangroviensis CBS 10435]
MSFLFRTSLRAASSSTPSSSRLTLPALSIAIRYNSTIPTSSSSSESTPPKSGELFSPPSSSSNSKNLFQSNGFSKLKFDPISSSASEGKGQGEDSDGEAWWRQLSKNAKEGFPTTPSTGRSIVVSRGGDFQTSYKRLQGLLRQSNLKKELRLQEYHEKPSVRRRRLISERHRRRFKEMPLEKEKVVEVDADCE